MRRKLTFALHSLDSQVDVVPVLDAFCEWLGDAIDAEVACEEAPDYATLAYRLKKREADIAWLAPIVFLRSEELVVPLVSMKRGGRGGFETALVVHADSGIRTIADLQGKRAAWVDEWSAAGYVIPRLRLRLDGENPKTIFADEHFYGSHVAAVRAVVDGEADVAGTYARVENGKVVDGPWQRLERPRVRILAVFGEIPADVVAVARTMPTDLRERVAAVLETAAHDPTRRAWIEQIFGATAFAPVVPESYDGLRTMLSLGDWDELSKV